MVMSSIYHYQIVYFSVSQILIPTGLSYPLYRGQKSLATGFESWLHHVGYITGSIGGSACGWMDTADKGSYHKIDPVDRTLSFTCLLA